MEALILQGTSYTPMVSFDIQQKTFEITGDSRPEDTHEFYQRLISWLHELLGNDDIKKRLNNEELRLKLDFDYLNSTSSKFILKVILTIKKLIDEGYNFFVDWHYDEPDIDMKELGEEFASIADVDINMVVVEV